jgi:hypothetical protein
MISTINMRGIWQIQWRFARLLTRKWWQVGNTSSFPTRQVKAAWKQAPLAFQCLNARQRFMDIHHKEHKDGCFLLWKSSDGVTWWYSRPGKHDRHPWP